MIPFILNFPLSAPLFEIPFLSFFLSQSLSHFVSSARDFTGTLRIIKIINCAGHVSKYARAATEAGYLIRVGCLLARGSVVILMDRDTSSSKML